MQEALVSADFWKFALPLLGAVAAWFTNEWRKRLNDQYQRKEASYKELLRSLRGFYVSTDSAHSLKTEFLNQLNISWLYCPDNVIRKAYEFLETVHSATPRSDQDKERAMAGLVLAIRTDLLSRKLVRATSLTECDFRHLQSGQSQ